MALNPLDVDAGTELFASYETDFKLVQADLSQKLDQIPELSGEPRNAAVSQAQRALEEGEELVRCYAPLHPYYNETGRQIWCPSITYEFTRFNTPAPPTLARPDAA